MYTRSAYGGAGWVGCEGNEKINPKFFSWTQSTFWREREALCKFALMPLLFSLARSSNSQDPKIAPWPTSQPSAHHCSLLPHPLCSSHLTGAGRRDQEAGEAAAVFGSSLELSCYLAADPQLFSQALPPACSKHYIHRQSLHISSVWDHHKIPSCLYL